MARPPPPPGRGLGDAVSLPVDTSSRAFRRSFSKPRFPFDRIDKNFVQPKAAPISFHWDSAIPSLWVANCANAPHQDVVSPMAPTAWGPVVPLTVDPYRADFGRIPPTLPKMHSPPACKLTNGILGIHSVEATCVGDPGGGEGGVGRWKKLEVTRPRSKATR
ncbi:hypothetical protein PVAP13_4KG247305 [Panicum virgatum]|uniref:Uncharacterized protein n=1 Tax=Panicum virgatum TaxID=38727 RepID=A0A8T0TT15_PANVG|nr:hypothetical protein PVAP13_4KG247305 [Panicum virgatum]